MKMIDLIKLGKYWCLVVACLMVVGIFGGGVQAADFQVSPVNAYVPIDGGEEKWLNYQLKNESQQDLVIGLEAQSFVPDENYGEPVLKPLEFAYLTLHEGTGSAVETILLPAGSEKQVQVKVAPPLGIEKREYPVTLIFGAEPASQNEVSNTRVNFGLGSNLIVQTDKSNLDKSQLSLFPVTFGWLTDSLVPIVKQLKVSNQGPSSTLIGGKLTLKSKAGEVIQEWELYPDLVLGHSTRLARGKTAPDGNGHVSLVTDFALPRPLFGEYVLEGEVVSGFPGTQQAPTQFRVEFLALPYLVMGGVAMVSLAVLLVLVRVKKRAPKSDLRAKTRQMQRQSAYFK